jgi:hypothetical protein
MREISVGINEPMKYEIIGVISCAAIDIYLHQGK